MLFMVLGCAAIRFTDDYLKLRRRHSLGLPGRWKMVGLVRSPSSSAAAQQRSAGFHGGLRPVAGWTSTSRGVLRPPLPRIAGTANSANLTVGSTAWPPASSVIVLLAFLAIAGIAWLRSGDPGARSDTLLDIATLAAALIGGTIGFLWYNAFPGELYMGDTGSFALGGAIAGFAIVTGTRSCCR